jgi:hypothetical protein
MRAVRRPRPVARLSVGQGFAAFGGMTDALFVIRQETA